MHVGILISITNCYLPASLQSAARIQHGQAGHILFNTTPIIVPSPYPLTTIWTPPPLCGSAPIAWEKMVDTTTCRPPGWENAIMGKGYYSPGICPDAYYIGCTTTGSDDHGNPIGPSETAGICMPRYGRALQPDFHGR